MEQHQRIASGAPWEKKVGYSRAVRKGKMIWVSGTTALEDGQVVGRGDAYLQAKHCLEIIRKALEAVGSRLEDVVRTRMYVTNIRNWEDVGQAHGEYFSEIRPCATLIEVRGLVDPDLLVEIEVEACMD